ncbi:MAG: hypothetical protein HY926_00790 [Elusimicrobia bacterium]|nr:hypothetical protein [Elusimicrobiota bacterium]
MSRRLWLEWLGVFLACCAMCAFFQFQSPYLPEPDVYFHIKAAALLRQHGFFREGFPWAHLSMWRDGYSDGSPLYHLLLIPFTFGDLTSGAKTAGVLFSGLAFSSFFMILTLNRVPHRVYWFWLLLAGGGFFWWRLLDVRPQVLSVTILMWSLHFLINGRTRAFALLCFLYPFAYVAAFLPVVFAAIRWAYLKAAEDRSEHRILLAGLGAYALGMLLHPYFPKNLLFFYVQNILVVWAAVSQNIDLSLGGEIFPLDTRQLLAAHFPLLFHLAGTLFVFMHRRPPLSRRTLVLFPIMLLVAGMALISKRFVEYAVPVATLFCAFAGSDILAGWSAPDPFAKPHPRVAPLAVAWLACVALATGSWVMVVRGQYARLRPPVFAGLARELRARAPAGELIYTCDWDEPPELLFFNDQHRYLVMMDPMFMYYRDPKLWGVWGRVSNGILSPDETYRAFRERFGTRFGVCGRKFDALRALIGGDRRYRILAEDEGGYAFEVLPAAAKGRGPRGTASGRPSSR